jgi:asparagine synthase (glutamine-hydrolysing)
MCGIFGVVNNEMLDLVRAKDALSELEHRGPNQDGFFFDNSVFVGHRRLSILDLSEAGRQPMVYKDVVIAVNGEIYNYGKLRDELISTYSFNSLSDSEVVLYGYYEWGIDGLLERLEGMYAICIYDSKQGKIILARDRVGIKPLYYGVNKGEFIWASELKSIESYYKNDDLVIDNTAIYDFLTYLYIPAPKTPYKNFFKVEPGAYVIFDIGRGVHEQYRYWKLAIKTDSVKISTTYRVGPNKMSPKTDPIKSNEKALRHRQERRSYRAKLKEPPPNLTTLCQD